MQKAQRQLVMADELSVMLLRIAVTSVYRRTLHESEKREKRSGWLALWIK